MAHLTPDFLQFHKDLAANNNRDWFNAQKKRYETSVKEPFYNFIEALLEAAQSVDDRIQITPKESIFRIYRDVRFSKDKSPYKIHSSAIINPFGRKKYDTPAGFYLEIHPEHFRVYSGLYQMNKEMLYSLRVGIATDLNKFEAMINEPNFVEHFGTIQGEKNKRLPKEFTEAAERQPLLFNKQFYYYSDLPQALLTTDNAVDAVIERYKIAKPVSDYLEAILMRR